MRHFMMLLFMLVGLFSYGKPNIVFIIADDLGAYTCNPYGCDTNLTPNIDSIATDGMRFLNMNSYSLCAPSRASFLTGREPFRTGVIGVAATQNLSTNEITIAKQLQTDGYETGVFGKWNLYGGSGPDLPSQDANIAFHGFDTNLTFAGNTIDYGDPTNQSTFTPYQYNQGALQFIEDNSSSEFFLLYSFGLAHSSYNVGTPFDLGPWDDDTDNFWSKMEYMDWCVSNILDKISSEGIVSNTIVIFMGDNGTSGVIDSSYNGNVIAGGKGHEDEKGAWVPFYVRWPGTVESNSTYSGIAKFTDIPVTLADIASVGMPSDRIVDGRSFYSQLTNGTAWRSPNILISAIQSIDGFSKNSTHKVLDGTTLYSITNKPYGDDILTNGLNQVDVINEIQLKYFYTNRTDNVFGDRSWGGSTNEYIFLD